MLMVKIEVADSREESAEDITAAAMAPMPKTKTYVGVNCWRAIGNIIDSSPRS